MQDEGNVDEVVLDPAFPDRVIRIGATLSPDFRNLVIDFLKTNHDRFA